jgi:hypothetical protein
MANSIFVGATAPVNFAATTVSDNVRWAGKPVVVEAVEFGKAPHKKGEELSLAYDVIAVCNDGSRRTLRVKLKDRNGKEVCTEDQLQHARLQARILQDAVKTKTPLLFAVVGSFSVKDWFCDFTDDFAEIEAKRAVCPF